MPAMLIVIGGLPGTGKSSLASALARVLDAIYLRVDTIEQAIGDATGHPHAVGAAGYVVAYALAEENVRLGRIVVAEGVNPVLQTRVAWKSVAERANVPLFDVELICSDPIEHRRRVEQRGAGIGGARFLTWSDVSKMAYEPRAGNRLVVDTAQHSPAENLLNVHRLLLAQKRALR